MGHYLTSNDAPAVPVPLRGLKREIFFRSRPARYVGDGLRSVPLEKTLFNIEGFFLASDVEVQFEMVKRPADDTMRSVLENLSSQHKPGDKRYFGKGMSGEQTLASACMELVERFAAGMRSDDLLHEASYAEMASEARDPRLFRLYPETAFDPDKKIDWVWGYSLTGSIPVLVPANLVFFPYEADDNDKIISPTDSNGIASGNNIEEAVLHGILELVERDAVMISEWNRLPVLKILPDILDTKVERTVQILKAKGFSCLFSSVPSDHPIPVISTFLQHKEDAANCSVAFGCHLDPSLAMFRALTEAVQLLPPSANHEEWLNSGSAKRYVAADAGTKPLSGFKSLVSGDLKKNIETCVRLLKGIGVEIMVVDLSLPDIPFSVVRVLATGLQPVIYESEMRLSERFFNIPVKLGLRNKPLDPADVKICPLCGYRTLERGH